MTSPAFLNTIRSQKQLVASAIAAGKCVVYGYLRNKDSGAAPAGSLYYVGITSTEKRPYARHSRGSSLRKVGEVPVPRCESLIRVLSVCETREAAGAKEQCFIKRYGRKGIDADGILLNRSQGGEQSALGCVRSSKTRKKLSESCKQRNSVGVLLAQREAVAMAKAERLGIPWDVYSQMTPADRARSAYRVSIGEKWDGDIVSQSERSRRRVESRQRAYAQEIGVDYELWVSFVKRQRNTVTARFRRGVRGAALLDGIAA